MAQLVKNLPAMQETWVRFLGWEDPLEKGKAAQTVKHLPAMQEMRAQPLGWKDSPGEGNGNPLQYPCLENLMDRGAW